MKPGNSSSKRAASWARISGGPKQEASLSSQTHRNKEKLQSEGYAVTHVFEVTWSSTTLSSCLDFQQLLTLIKTRAIDAVAVYDRDRLQCSPDDPGLDRLMFLSLCRVAGVKIIVCAGPPFIDAPEGKILELILSIVKEGQVTRARQGSRDGLHDRVTLRHLPVTYRAVYGFDWDKEGNRLLPNAQCLNVKLIFDLVLNQGWSYQPVMDELKRRGILSPTGQPEWNKSTLSGILHNPTYAGRFYALKSRVVEPSQPKKSSRVNSSQKRLPLSEAHYMPEIEVVDPPITWEQRGRILQQLAEHQKLSQRNARADYLLRGLVVCGIHRGKQGEPRRYYGRPHQGSFAYICPASTRLDKCFRPFIRGPELDEAAKFFVKMLFIGEADDIVASNAARRRSIEDLDRELRELDTKYQKKTQQLTRAYRDLVDGKIDEDMYDVFKASLFVERNGIAARQKELLAEKAEVGREKAAVESLQMLAMKYSLRVLSTELGNAEWRDIFTTLNFHIRVEAEDPVFEVGVPLSTNVPIALGNPEPG